MSPRETIPRAERERILNVANHGIISVRRADDFDDIETEARRFGFDAVQIAQGRATHGAALAAVHGGYRPAKLFATPRFDLDEYQRVGGGRAGDKIQFAPRAEAHVSSEDLVADLFQEVGRELFAPGASALGLGLSVRPFPEEGEWPRKTHGQS